MSSFFVFYDIVIVISFVIVDDYEKVWLIYFNVFFR